MEVEAAARPALVRTATDPRAFDQFYLAHAQRMLLFFTRRTLDAEVALDLTAETFAQAFAGRGRFRGASEEGRVARRTLPGSTTFTILARPDVVSVTIATPRGVRTLTPAGHNHSVLAVYDGTFPAGDIRVTAQFDDGTTKTMTLPFMGL